MEYFTRLMSTMTDEDALFRYAEGKWSVKQVLGHLIDCERVFAYRAMCIARGETQALPGFDENAYVANASFDQRPIAHILDEFVAVRLGTILLYDSLSSVEQLLSGVANNNPVTVRSLMWIIAGHTQHHLRILEEKYGVTSDK
ncbi:MAG: DinB family protein [Bacteroidota bacterium]